MKPGLVDVKVYYVNSLINMVRGAFTEPWRLWKRLAAPME
jgi:hypothetical protein